MLVLPAELTHDQAPACVRMLAQAIKAAGGLCLAQDPDTADFGSMPRSLIHSGYADQVLKPRDMPAVCAIASPEWKSPSARARSAEWASDFMPVL